MPTRRTFDFYREKLKKIYVFYILGGLGVTCSPPDPRFAGSNPAEVDGFFSERKNPEH